MDFRKVQQAGYSTLVVSLPKNWVNEVGLKQGDVISLRRDDDGNLRLSPGIAKEERGHIKCIVDADQCTDAGLLGRVITGAYIIGYDLIQICSKRELSRDHLAEVRSAAQRLSGMGIVEQRLNQLTLQSFIDPAKFPVEVLLRRLCTIASSMQSALARAISQANKDLANEVLNMEDEVDKLYWLVIRQLVLAVKDRELRSETGIVSPMHIVGNRVVANALESVADSAEAIAKEVLRVLVDKPTVDADVLSEISEFARFVHNVYEKTTQAFFSQDMKVANNMIAGIEESEELERQLTEKILAHTEDSRKESMLRIGTMFGLRTIVWNLGEIARYSRVVAEVTINRTLERPGQICKFEKIELTKL